MNGKSLTAKVRDIIRERIAGYNFMDRLPSEQELSSELGVSRNTVREALKALEAEGLILSRHGIGTFVTAYKDETPSIKYNLSLLDSITRIISENGAVPGTKAVFFDKRVAPEHVARRLCGEDSADVMYIERVRTANDEPVVFVEDYIPYIPGMIEAYSERNEGPLFAFMNHYIPVSFSSASIHSVISDARLMEKFNLTEPKALLLLQQTHYSEKGQPIIYSDGYFLTDKFEFNIIRRGLE